MLAGMTVPMILTANQERVLHIVADGPIHAYAIAALDDGIGEALARKMLRELEALGLVESVFSASTQGPPRRVFTLTDAGRAALA